MAKRKCESDAQTRDYNSWSPEEDALLVDGMLHLVNTGKVINGAFKNGAFQDLQKYMQSMLPGCAKRANPHIKSRHKYLKKQYHAICEMRGDSCSGFGWDSERQCITADDGVFEEWIKVHPNASGIKNKPFPCFDKLCRVFGKDRATGAAAESAADAVEELDKEEQMLGSESMPNSTSYTLLDDDFEDISQFMTSDAPNIFHGAYSAGNKNSNHTSPSSSQAPNGKKKQKVSDTEMLIQSFTSQMTKLEGIFQGAGGHISKLADCFQHEQDAAERRMKIYEELKKIKDISEIQRLTVARKLVKCPFETDFFFSLDDEARSTYVLALLIPDA
ncbi:uncharacterized protein LOC126666303 [Mercurialis annua]|uniref:uncharacterized protein LOC126666303 n=1 Tax=Mercurialis annua TaxID=3986 RepID=UPI00216049BD|nr:uncharacterized protein LOC126666303 [Mercurialis annua]